MEETMTAQSTIDTPKVCIAVYDSAQDAEQYRLDLLNTGVRFAWSDDTKCEVAGGYGLWVRQEDARGAYMRLKAISRTKGSSL